MSFLDALSGFVNEQVFGLSILIIALGFVLSKYAKVDKKKLPILFVLIAVPISVIYHVTLANTENMFNRVMDGVYQSMFSICIAMGFYDIGKPLIKAIKNRFKEANGIELEEETKEKVTVEPVPVKHEEFKCPFHEGG